MQQKKLMTSKTLSYTDLLSIIDSLTSKNKDLVIANKANKGIVKEQNKLLMEKLAIIKTQEFLIRILNWNRRN